MIGKSYKENDKFSKKGCKFLEKHSTFLLKFSHYIIILDINMTIFHRASRSLVSEAMLFKAQVRNVIT